MRCLLGHNWELILGPSQTRQEGDGMVIEFFAYMRCMTCHKERKLTDVESAEIRQLYTSAHRLTVENIKDKSADEIMNLRIRLQTLEKENARLKEWKQRVEKRYTEELEDLDKWIEANNKDTTNGSR